VSFQEIINTYIKRGYVIMFDELIERLKAILQEIEQNASNEKEVVSELEDIIDSLKNSKCSNDMFCGMDKKW